MIEQAEREVVELHQFFEDWFRGFIADSPENFARVASVLADQFCIIPPNGVPVLREELVERLQHAYGTSMMDDEPFEIWIENFHAKIVDGVYCLATYEEYQKENGQTNGRISTVLFRVRENVPNSLEWVHLHETLLQ